MNRVGLPRQQHWRTDAAGIGHGVGIRDRTQADAGTPQRNAGDIPGRNDQRKAEGGLAVGHGQQSGQFQLHADRLAGRDVARAHREYFEPLFFGDGGPATFAEGSIIFGPRRAPFLQHPVDHPFPDVQLEPSHARPRRQREDIGRFQRLGVNVDEGLGHRQPIQQAGDPAVHCQALQR